jgi:hypothetical protein
MRQDFTEEGINVKYRNTPQGVHGVSRKDLDYNT